MWGGHISEDLIRGSLLDGLQSLQRISAAFELQVLPWMILWAGWCKLASRSLHSQGVLGLWKV